MNPPIEYGVSAYVSLSIISNASPTRKSTIAVITMVRTSTRDFVGFFFFFFTVSPPFFMLLLYTNVSIKSIGKMRKNKKILHRCGRHNSAGNGAAETAAPVERQATNTPNGELPGERHPRR